MIYIGTKIKRVLFLREKSVIWLAEQLQCSRNNVYKIFNKQSIDCGLLFRISKILDYDFFMLYCEELEKEE